MKYSIDRSKHHFSFSSKTTPVVEINSGDEVVFKTLDAHNCTVPEEGQDVNFPDLDLREANPITGPVEIRQAESGDILKVSICRIKLDTRGFVPARKEMGSIQGLVPENLARNLKIRDDLLYFSDEIKIPINPMIGTIGVAPKDKDMPSVSPGEHGGNMDNNDIRAGSIVYFPVFVKGALLSIGDVHASMGDGEVTSGGVDINSEVTVKIELIKGMKINRPIIETDDHFVVTSNAPDFYQANRIATLEMIDLLMKGLGVTKIKAYWLISICGDLKVSQACDCPLDLTLRLSFPKNKKLLKWKNIFGKT